MFKIGQHKSGVIHGRILFQDGQWRQQTSGCKDPREAEDTFATMQYFMNQSAKPHNHSRQALLNLMRKVYQEKYHEECPLVTTDEYFARFVDAGQHYVAGNTQARTAKAAEWYLKFLSSEGRNACLLEDNSPAVIKRFGAFLVNVAKHNVASANSRLESVRTIFAAAVSEQHLAKNPAIKIRLKDRSAESQEEIEIHQPYTKAHVYAGIERGIAPGCCPEMAVFHLISCDIGARGGDVFALDRSMFHRSPELQKNHLKYYARKAKKWHKVYPLDPTVLLIQEYLDYHLFDKSERALFFPTFGRHTGPEVPDADFNCGSAKAIWYFGLFLDALKIRVLLATESDGRDRYSHSSHSGRVSCITMSAQAGMAESVTRARVLHKGAQVHRLYQKHSPEAVQRAVSGGYNEEGIVNITLDEFKAAVVYATERLRSLRGKLDLHNGTEVVGDKTNRASLIPAQVLPPADPA
jgi:hypothetical protein